MRRHGRQKLATQNSKAQRSLLIWIQASEIASRVTCLHGGRDAIRWSLKPSLHTQITNIRKQASNQASKQSVNRTHRAKFRSKSIDLQATTANHAWFTFLKRVRSVKSRYSFISKQGPQKTPPDGAQARQATAMSTTHNKRTGRS